MNTYLDNAATTKPDILVLEAMMPFFKDLYGNPSANNKCGRTIREAIDEARFNIADNLNCTQCEIIFTSGATESNNLAIKGCADFCSDEKYHFIFSSIEHKSVLNLKDLLLCKGHEVDLIEALPNGSIDLNHLEDLIKDNTVMISCIYVNNETGIIQPVSDISEICLNRDIVFHIDATQAFGKMKIDLTDLKCDFLSLSGHKFHGPKGVGVLYKNRNTNLTCQIIGGSQEDGYRSGTENVPGIIGIGKATEIANNKMVENYNHLLNLEKYFIKKMNASGIEYNINGDVDIKVPWIFNITILNKTAEELVEGLQDFCFSKSSACSKGNYPSHVLKAMGLDDDLIDRSIRVSFSKYTDYDDIDKFVNRLEEEVEK